MAAFGTSFRVVVAAILALAGVGDATVAAARGVDCADSASAAAHPHRCKKAQGAASKASDPSKSAAKGHPAIESSGTSPAIDTEMSLLKPGTFRLDMSAYYTSYIAPPRGDDHASTIQGAFLLGYGVSERFTIFAGAIESNNTYSSGPVVAEYLAPKVGFVYRLADARQFYGNTLDLVSSFGTNEVLKPPIPSVQPYGDIGSILKARLLATRELGHGLTLQASGGLQTAFVEMYNGPTTNEGTYLNAIVGLAAQYRLAPISDRLYLNAELDWLKPLTDDSESRIYASPFGTLESYSAGLGATYVIKPQFIIVRALDTVAYNKIDEYGTFLHAGPHHTVTNTIGLTLSVLGRAPTFWH